MRHIGSSGVRIDSAEKRASYVLRGQKGRYLKLSPSAHFLLSQFAAGATAESVAQTLSDQLGRPVSAAEVTAAHEAVLRQVADIENRPGRASPFGLWLRMRIMPAAAVVWLTRRLAWLFHPAVATVLGLAGLAAFVRNAKLVAAPAATMADPAFPFLAVLTLLLVSLLAHELGHASACARYGVIAEEIGFGLYWVYPAFYSDVSGAWTLTRRQRIVVDLAGTYLQLLVGAAYLELFRATGWEAARLAFYAVLYVAIFMMLPIFKFDGYWLLSDGFGVVNLSRQSGRLVRHVGRRLLGRPTEPLPWPARTGIAVGFYAVLSGLFLGVFMTRLVTVLSQLALSYPARVAGLVRDISLPPHELATGRLHSVIVPTYVLLGAVLAVVKISRWLGRGLRHAFVVRRGRDSGRADRLSGAPAGEPGRADQHLPDSP